MCTKFSKNSARIEIIAEKLKFFINLSKIKHKAMKKYTLILLAAASLTITSCGGEEPVETVTPSDVEKSSNMMNNLLQQGIQEASQQLADSSSMLNYALDTLKNVIGDNKELIEDKVEEGINALNKSM